MKDFQKTKLRYLRDPLAIRLGGLAADLARVASTATNPANANAVETLLEEARRFIEWSAAEAEPAVAGQLVDLQLSITLWVAAWPQAQQNATLRAFLAHQSRCWSDWVLDASGLLKQESSND